MIQLTIVSPHEEKQLSIVWLEVDTTNVGNFVIKSGHAPMILAIAPTKPITVLLSNGKQELITVKNGGFLHIQREALTLLLNI